MSNSCSPILRPTRLLCPGVFPGRNTGLACPFLLQGIFLTLWLDLCLLHCRWILNCWVAREDLRIPIFILLLIVFLGIEFESQYHFSSEHWKNCSVIPQYPVNLDSVSFLRSGKFILCSFTGYFLPLMFSFLFNQNT